MVMSIKELLQEQLEGIWRLSREYGKDHKVLWLEGADHFSNTLFYHHKMELYTAMTDYLANDCFKNSNKISTEITVEY